MKGGESTVSAVARLVAEFTSFVTTTSYLPLEPSLTADPESAEAIQSASDCVPESTPGLSTRLMPFLRHW